MKKLKYKYSELANIASCIKSLYSQGIPLLNVFDLLDDLPITSNYKISFKHIRYSISKGKTLEESFKKYSNIYPDLFIQTITIGERYGNLTEVLSELEKIYTKLDRVNKKIKSSISYPIFIVVTILLLFFFIVVFAIPTLYGVFDNLNSDVPPVCETLYRFSGFIKEKPILFILGIIIYFAVTPILLMKLKSKENTKEFLIKIKIVREFYEYMILLYLLLIFKSGIGLSQGIDMCITSIDDKYIKKIFRNILSKITKGNSFYDAIEDEKIFSRYSKALIKIGEESGDIEGRIEFACNKVEERVMHSVDVILNSMQPATIIFMGVIVGAFLITIVLPLFSSLYGGGI